MKAKMFNHTFNKKLEADLNQFLKENPSLNIRFITQSHEGLYIIITIFYD